MIVSQLASALLGLLCAVAVADTSLVSAASSSPVTGSDRRTHGSLISAADSVSKGPRLHTSRKDRRRTQTEPHHHTTTVYYNLEGSYFANFTLYPNEDDRPLNELAFSWGALLGGHLFSMEVLDSSCQNPFTDINIHLDESLSPTGPPSQHLSSFDYPDGFLDGWFDISGIDDTDPDWYSGSTNFCTCASHRGDLGDLLERKCVIIDLTVDTFHQFSSVNAIGQDDASIVVESANVEQVTTPVVFLADESGNAITDPVHVYDLAEDILLNFQPSLGLVLVDMKLRFTSSVRGIDIIQRSHSQDPIVDVNSITVNPNAPDCNVLEAGPTKVLVSWTVLLQDLGKPNEEVDLIFSGDLYTDIGGSRRTRGNRGLETHEAKVVPFSFTVRAQAPGRERLSTAASGGIAAVLLVALAGFFAYVSHKHRPNPQVCPTKKSTDAKTLETCSTISSIGSQRSIHTNNSGTPVSVNHKRLRDIESQRHAPTRSQRSMASPTRVTKEQHSIRPAKVTARSDGRPRRPKSHRDAPSSSGSQRNLKHNRDASSRTSTEGHRNPQGEPKASSSSRSLHHASSGHRNSKGEPKAFSSSRSLRHASSQPTTSSQSYRKERRPALKHHPSSKELA